MKNFAFVLVFLTIASILLCSCSFKNKTQTINYQGRLKKYIQQSSDIKKIDLSEGPKLRYEANFGPNDLNFDIKIKNPY
ncbi:MAG: hypothetical protein MJ230_03680 [bacterium]|nr:hypothetical protein [bacterium]